MKLLQYTVKSFLLYALLLILLAIPAFYLIMRALFMQDVDEALLQHKQLLTEELIRRPDMLQRLPWHDLSGNIELSAAGPAPPPQRILTINHYNGKTGEEEPFRELHTVITTGGASYAAVIRISLINSEDLAQGILLTQLLLLVLLMGGLIWVNRRQSKKLWRPFYEMLEQLRSFELDTSAPLRFSPTRVHEFLDLQKTITQLTEQNYRVYLQQKQFTENAAHEMQTPLAILQAKLELLIQHTLDNKQARVIQSLNDAVGRLSRLNQELLLLTKIENRQFAETREISLPALMRRLLAQWDMQIALRQLTVKESFGDVSLKANPALTETLFSNLISNALHYTPVNGRICITTCRQYAVISNSGPPLPFPEEKLFDRFQKGSHTGTGLGLAIAKQIGEINGWHIEYAYKEGLHRFAVQFTRRAALP